MDSIRMDEHDFSVTGMLFGFMICSSYTRPVCQAAWSLWPLAI